MFLDRLKVVIFMIPVIILANALGGWVFFIFIAASLGIAGWEFARVFERGEFAPWRWGLIGGSALFSLRFLVLPPGREISLVCIILLVMTYFVVFSERDQKSRASDFGITLAGIIYIGGLGAYIIALRNLPQGAWWFLLVLPASWFADMGAYFVGSQIGKHKMSPHLSPKKSWEGYFGGIVFGTVFTALLGLLWHQWAPTITWQIGLLLGLISSIVTVIGDLGVSMFKRQFGVKDSSNLLRGHGGMLDRIDTWLWSAVIGYYFILFFV